MKNRRWGMFLGMLAGAVLGAVGMLTMGAGGASSYSVTTDGSQVLITDNNSAVLYFYTTSGSGWTLNGSVDLTRTGSPVLPVTPAGSQ